MVHCLTDEMQVFGLLTSCVISNIVFKPSHCFETRDLNIFLNSDGSVAADSITPTCGTDNKIRLISYNYRRRKCHISTDCYTEHEEPLSPAAEFSLHRMCSWKDKCNNLTFPLRSVEQVNVTNAINIKYRCLDHRNTYVNMCKTVETNFTNTIYLTSDQTVKLFQECYCYATKGKFSIGIIDLRLSKKIGKLCSPATVLINSKEFKCDSAKDDFGAIFNINYIESTSKAFIALKLNSLLAIPDKVLLSLTPEAWAKLSCSEKKLMPASFAEATTLTSKKKILWTIMPNDESVTSAGILSTDASSGNQAADNVLNENAYFKRLVTGLIVVVMVLGLLLLFLLYPAYLFIKSKWKCGMRLKRTTKNPSDQTPDEDNLSKISDNDKQDDAATPLAELGDPS